MFQCSENFSIMVATVSQVELMDFMTLETENARPSMPNLLIKEGFTTYNKPKVTESDRKWRSSMIWNLKSGCGLPESWQMSSMCSNGLFWAMWYSQRIQVWSSTRFCYSEKGKNFKRDGFHFRRIKLGEIQWFEIYFLWAIFFKTGPLSAGGSIW